MYIILVQPFYIMLILNLCGFYVTYLIFDTVKRGIINQIEPKG